MKCSFCGDEAVPGFAVCDHALCPHCRKVLTEIVDGLPLVSAPRFSRKLLEEIRALPETDEPET